MSDEPDGQVWRDVRAWIAESRPGLFADYATLQLSFRPASRVIALNSNPRRLCIFSFHDDQGVVDDYVVFLLTELRRFADKIIVCAQGHLNDESEDALRKLADDVVRPPFTGSSLAAYGYGLEQAGTELGGLYDEVLLVDDSSYGPLFPLEEMFATMGARSCDIWGVTGHPALKADAEQGVSAQPFFLDVNFLVIRNAALRSHAFRAYWKLTQGRVGGGASSFTTYFSEHGFRCEAYIEAEKYGTKYPALFDVDETIRDRNPFILRRAFTDEPGLMERYAADLPRALRILGESSAYDQALIWGNVVRRGELRSINTNAALTSVLPDVRIKGAGGDADYGRVAVCVHMYYVDMLDEILALVDTIPCAFDFIATTESEAKKAVIEEALAGRARIGNVIVRVVEENRGRDMSALFITCRDLFLEDRYDLVCRLHTKKSPQVWAGRANMFKRHMFENLLHSPGFTSNVLDMFQDRPSVGVAVPPLIHIAYPTMGHVWFANRQRVESLAKELDLQVPLDPDTPIGAFGSMFWFRPRALRKLFAHPWHWSDFDGEPYPNDGSLGHALERLICYVAQDAGYMTQQIVSSHQAEWTYGVLEYKLQKLASGLPFADFRDQVAFLHEWKKANYRPSRLPAHARWAGQLPTIGEAWMELVLSMRRSFVHRLPAVASLLRPLYWRWMKKPGSLGKADES